MPNPSDYDSKDAFIDACIPAVIDDGTAEDQEQAVAICFSMWENRAAQNSALEDRSMEHQNPAEPALRRDDCMRVERVASVDVDNGTFGMTLATEGEASDGHILSVDGAQMVERMPMLISHWNEPTKAAGSIFRMRRHLQDTPKRLTAVGMMELDGDGEGVTVRRDLMHMIAKGHVNAVSVRWDFDWKDVIPRTKLPTDHPHFVDAEKEVSGSPKRWGYFFKKWTPREGSIVALGADPKALIGRSQDTTGKISDFWARMAEDAKLGDAAGGAVPDPSPGAAVKPDLPALIAVFGAHVRELNLEVQQLLRLGAPFDELMWIFEANKPVAPIDETVVRLMQRIETLEERLHKAENGRVGVAPPATDSLGNVVRQAIEEIRRERRTQFEEFRALIRARKGQVS